MADETALSRAHVILSAVQLATDADIQKLRHLTARHPEVLKLELLLRILLTYLPESVEPASYTGFLSDLTTGNLNVIDEANLDPILPVEVTNDEARRQVHKLHLLPLADPKYSCDGSIDTFTMFLLHRAYRVDAETGALPIVQELLEPFLEHSQYLRTWLISILLPLLRLDYEYYPQRQSNLSLEAFEKLDIDLAVSTLLSGDPQQGHVPGDQDIPRDLRGLVGPWMYGESMRKRRKLGQGQRRSSVVVSPEGLGVTNDVQDNANGGWLYVYKWLLEHALRDFPKIVDVVEKWDGPQDLDYGGWDDATETKDEESLRTSTWQYAQAAIAAIYATNDEKSTRFEGGHTILVRVSQLVGLLSPPELALAEAIPSMAAPAPEHLRSISQANFFRDALLQAQNPLTAPNAHSTSFLYYILVSALTLEALGHSLSCRKSAELALFGTEEEQREELRKTLHGINTTKAKDNNFWKTVRQRLLWLQNWDITARNQRSEDSVEHQGVFCKIGKASLEQDVLKAFLIGTCYNLAIETYCKPEIRPLPLDVVEDVVMEVVMSCYDGASNGNKTRGGIRRASEINNMFLEFWPESSCPIRLNALVEAANALSYYSLTLEHGVPFKPVNMRAHQDPISLIGKVLDQNPHSYTKVDDLIDIGSWLVKAKLVKSAPESAGLGPVPTDEGQQLLAVKRRITAMAIEAALAEEDFDTAYSYVVNRLAPPCMSPPINPLVPVVQRTQEDDISWRAAYQAGCHRPALTSGPSALRRLEQRMELLSQSLLLAPPSALEEVLRVWLRCEDEINVLLTQEMEEETKWNDMGDRSIPGGFSADSIPVAQKTRESTRSAMNEDAPMGLFDVARGAAAALSKNAFPLRNATAAGKTLNPPAKARQERPMSALSSDGSDQGSWNGEGQGRVRKRDMVSNMVTGGLASGIGWVLGAPPSRQE